jgi:hypothetical protein
MVMMMTMMPFFETRSSSYMREYMREKEGNHQNRKRWNTNNNKKENLLVQPNDQVKQVAIIVSDIHLVIISQNASEPRWKFKEEEKRPQPEASKYVCLRAQSQEQDDCQNLGIAKH